MKLDLKDKTALVTASTGGIGMEIVHIFPQPKPNGDLCQKDARRP